MKKICFVVYNLSDFGGAGQVAVNLANAMCEQYEVIFYSICRDKRQIPYDINKKIKIYYGIEGENRIRQLMFKMFFPFIKFVKEHKVDVVMNVGGYTGGITSLTRFFVKAKYVFCDHGALMNQWDDKTITCIRWLSAKCSDKVVVLTDKTKQDYQEKFHISEGKVVRIYNWIESELLKKEHIYNEQSKKILSVGRFGKEKGYDLLVKVAEKVLPIHPEWEWHVYGDGETFEEIQKVVKQKNLDKQLILKGECKNVKYIFNEYAVFVLPSYREGLPLVLLEAKASGLPMVSFDIQTGPNEIIENENGFLIKPYDCDEMAKVVDLLIKNKKLRLQLSKGTKQNLYKFDRNYIFNQWVQLFFEL